MEYVTKNQQIREALTNLATAHKCAVAEIEQAMVGLNQVLEVNEIHAKRISSLSSIDNRSLEVDPKTFNVFWKNSPCSLGNTLLFLFFKRLAESPNRYVSDSELLEEVWGGEERKPSTIRGIAKRLRDKFKESGLEQLAKAIDGSTPGHYCLKLV